MVNNYPDISKISFALTRTITSNIETLRRLRVLSCLLHSSSIISNIINVPDNLYGRRSDGGWTDVEETMWAVTALDLLNGWDISSPILRNNSINWLNGQKTQEGAWGRNYRDIARIPITGMLLTILPELADDRSINWLENEWKEDLTAPAQLTYKGALFLSASAKNKLSLNNNELIDKTISYLANEQNPDGGFAPWKGHPIGSEPWSTGIVLIGLSAWPTLVNHDVFLKALGWLGQNQLPNGLWPCHYLEEGSAYCFWGAIEALKVIKRAGLPCAA